MSPLPVNSNSNGGYGGARPRRPSGDGQRRIRRPSGSGMTEDEVRHQRRFVVNF